MLPKAPVGLESTKVSIFAFGLIDLIISNNPVSYKPVEQSSDIF